MELSGIIQKSRDAEPLSLKELTGLLEFPPDSPESYQVMAEARRISEELSKDRAEVHAQFALNLAPCPKNCKFCSFASKYKVFERSVKLTPEEAVACAKILEGERANALYLMTTADYDFGEFIEISQEVRKNLKPETTLIANVGDKDADEAGKIKDAGYTGVYHALRLREGRDTSIAPEKRLRSMDAFRDAGLVLGTCVEPVGPEHSNEEIGEMILFTASLKPAYSGSARRITIPGSDLAGLGMISELRMAQIVAVTRLGMGRETVGNCTHEPCTLGALAGANLFWAEMGANPRDTTEKTEEGRGFTVPRCRELFRESEWGLLDGFSLFYGGDGNGG
jgi:biotin synthase